MQLATQYCFAFVQSREIPAKMNASIEANQK